jgi:hypothetical protein
MIKKTTKRKSKETKSDEVITSMNPKLQSLNDNYEFNKQDLNKLIRDAIEQWRKEFNNNIVKTDSINDLEKLIKLNFLLLDEKEKLKSIIDKIMLKIIDILKTTINDPELKITLFEKIKSIEYEEII